MTGLPDYNYPAFDAAADAWRSSGWDVLNPAESFGRKNDLPYDWYLREAVRLVTMSDAIALLPGWALSKGALLELHLAVVLGLDVYDNQTMLPIHMEIDEVAGWIADKYLFQEALVGA
jgi:uncharacterized protein DUF4406